MARGTVTNINRNVGETDDSILAAPDENFLQRIRDIKASMEAINTKRAALGAERTGLLEGITADHGVNKAAMLAAFRYVDLDEEKQKGWDLTYQVTRRACGKPVQMDLFEAQLEQSVKKAAAKAKIAESKRKANPTAEAEALFAGGAAVAGNA